MQTPLSLFGLTQLNRAMVPDWRFISLYLLLILCFQSKTFAQNIIWNKTFGGSNQEVLSSVQRTNDGGYILGGWSGSGISGNKTVASKGANDFWVVKLKADGSKEWEKAIGSEGNDHLVSVQQTRDGGFILGGVSDGGVSGDKTEDRRGRAYTWDYWIVKLNANGSKEWDKTFGGGEGDWGDELTSLQQTSDGGYILGGWTDSGKSGDKSEGNKGVYDFWIVKIKSDGSKEWDKTIGGDNGDYLTSMQQTRDGGYILGGASGSGKSGDKTQANKSGDYWVVKLKSDGSKEWDKTIGSDNGDYLTSVQQTRDGGYLLGGYSSSGINGHKSEASKGSDDYWIVQLQADGSKVWDKTIGGKNYDQLTSLQQTSDGGYILGGYSNSKPSGDKSEERNGEEGEGYFNTSDYWVVKLNADRSKVWDKTVKGKKNSHNKLAALQQTSDGNFIVAGTSNYSSGLSDYWVVKLGDSGRNIPQAITFEPIAYKNSTDKPFALSATATSGLPVTFSVISGPATVKGNMVTITGLGEVIIKAYQAGNATYKSAEATRTFLVRDDILKSWDKTFGGTNLDQLTAMVATSDDGYLLGGFSTSGVTGNKSQANKGKKDYWLVKTNKQGQKVWDKAFGSSGSDSLTSIIATPDDGYLLGGSSNSGKSNDKSQASKGNTDYWIVKIDSQGNKLWDKTYGGNKADNLSAILATSNRQYLLGGSSNSDKSGDKSQAGKGKSDYWLVLIDELGNKIWDQTYGGDKSDNLAAIIATNNGGYLVGGSSASGKSSDKSQETRGLEDYWILRLKADGTKLWDKTYGGITEAFQVEDCFEEDPANCFYLNGRSVLTSLAATQNGGFMLGGSSNAAKGGEKSEDNLGTFLYNDYLTDYWVVKIDENGNKVWDNTYNGLSKNLPDGHYWSFFTGNSTLKTIFPTTDGNYLLAGTSDADKGVDKSQESRFEDPYSSQRDDYWVIKIDESGTKIKDWTIGGFSNDHLTAIVPVAEEGYVLGGYSVSRLGADKSENSWDISENFRESSDYWIVKIEEELPLTAQWNMRYGGSGNEGFTTIIKTADGGYLSGGYSASGVSGDKSQASQGKNDYWIVKSDKDGKKLWDKRYGGSADDYLNRIIQTKDGGYLLAGSSLSGKSGDKSEASHGDRDYWLLKIDKVGTKEWDKSYGGSGYDELKKVLQLSTGEYILAGYSNSPVSGNKTQASQGGNDFWIVKISSKGEKFWDKRYGGKEEEVLGGIVPTAEEGFLLGGSSWSGKSGNKTEASRGKSDFWLVAVDNEGQQLWDKTYGGIGEDQAFSLGKAGKDYFIAGQSDSPAGLDKIRDSQGGLDYWLLKVSSTGEKVWDKRYGGSKDDELRASIQTQDGGYLLAGKSFSNKSGNKRQDSQGSSDYWMVKADKEGQYEWSKTFGGSGAEELRAVIQTSEGGYLLGGKSDSGVSGDRTQPSQGGTDYWLVKVAPEDSPIVAEREATLVAEPIVKTELSPLTVYPNPAKDQVTIRFTLLLTQDVSLKVYNNQGQEVSTIFQGEVPANQTYTCKWNAGTHSAGIYILRLQTKEQDSHRKIMLVR
ncbi:T9SS type A sorting domain-containing protein [Adhaeribacter radiodurans]|uniref:T9SS type A sorting domain-containing protein n=1 Tax=Adhaeribacter radiodurans TaxID=2745197 RepID=A0A7L7LDX8_9BACT|nr:T9SS type A sorting domain-containing protein [Adhaeribacter radiodurans]QMU31046.1 T9SS type A sorting domain-containing protein [Adhaeribacter radiodurans]